MAVKSERENKLMNEFITTYKNIMYLPMKIQGFVRFDIINNEIVELTKNTIIYRIFLLIVSNMGVAYLIFVSTVNGDYLKLPDGIALIYFSLYANMLLINQTFVNKNSGVLILNEVFNVDAHLGVEETKFMRKIEAKTCKVLIIGIAIADMFIGVFLYSQYDVNMTIHVIGSTFFFWLAFCYNDYAFMCIYLVSNALRAHFLNVALAKIGGVKLNYLSQNSVLNIIFWRKEYNDLVNYNGAIEDYKKGFDSVFKTLRVLEKFYSFPVCLGFTTIVVGTFVSSQTFIERLKTGTKLDQETVISGWNLLSWGFMILASILVDLFQQQIEQTKLICACILLKPNKPEVYKLSKAILRLLERRDPRLAVFSLYYFDTGIILRMASATMVYITVQLQLAFPNTPTARITVNATEETPPLP